MTEHRASLCVTTRSGAVYEFTEGLTYVRRVGSSETTLRRDGEWVRCLDVKCALGQPMHLVLDGVAAYGETFRVTTVVEDIERVG